MSNSPAGGPKDDGVEQAEQAYPTPDAAVDEMSLVGDSFLELSADQQKAAEFGLLSVLGTAGFMSTVLPEVAQVKVNKTVAIMDGEDHYLAFDLLDAAGNKVVITDRAVKSRLISGLTMQMNYVGGCQHAQLLFDGRDSLLLGVTQSDFERLVTKGALQNEIAPDKDALN